MSQQYYDVGPGFWGFVVVFCLAIAVWLLSRSLTRKVRRQKLEEERQATPGIGQADAGAADAGAGDAADAAGEDPTPR